MASFLAPAFAFQTVFFLFVLSVARRTLLPSRAFTEVEHGQLKQLSILVV
jgi:hypothetical protein